MEWFGYALCGMWGNAPWATRVNGEGRTGLPAHP
jgi:hypothetical protein